MDDKNNVEFVVVGGHDVPVVPIENVAMSLGISLDEAVDAISKVMNIIQNELTPLLAATREMVEIEQYKMTPPPCEIKRRIKYAKNPMEVKALNRQLNKSYKVYNGK